MHLTIGEPRWILLESFFPDDWIFLFEGEGSMQTSKRGNQLVILPTFDSDKLKQWPADLHNQISLMVQ